MSEKNEQQYNVIVGTSFDGNFISYVKENSDNGYNLKYLNNEELNQRKEAKFSEKELKEFYEYLGTDDMKPILDYAKQYTFKVGQSNALNNPFKK